jgi:hypothetical protein
MLLATASAPAWAARCDLAGDPITLAETQQMNYGTIAAASGGGTVKIAATGAVTAPSGFAVSGVPAAGKFRVTGKTSCVVSISFLAGSLVGLGTAMAINNFTTNAGANPTLDNSTGVLNFAVGADLVVNAGQLGGSYSGTYSVTVIYQ